VAFVPFRGFRVSESPADKELYQLSNRASSKVGRLSIAAYRQAQAPNRALATRHSQVVGRIYLEASHQVPGCCVEALIASLHSILNARSVLY